MESKKDKQSVLNQINELKIHSDSIQECLSAIQLLMVDNNNSRIKDNSLKDELNNLAKQINSISSSINSIEEQLM